jgi:two-component system, cell cycle response regulator
MTGVQTRVTKVASVREPGPDASEYCLVELYGPQLGRRYVLGGEHDAYSIGREDGNFIVVDLDNVSRRHAQVLRREGQFLVTDLRSTNGTYLNDEEIRGEQPLRSGDLVKVGGAIFKFLAGDDIESLYHEEIYQLTISDGLTQISNKRYFLEYLEREMGRCHRYNRALSLLLFDLDHFKQLNDTHGHLAGDAVLRELAAVVKARVRKEECFARFGGEEFAYVVPETGGDNARKLAEKLRKLIADHRFAFEGKDLPVTVSIGVADLLGEMTEPTQFIKVADQNLYQAKKAGRNRVVG